MKPPTFDNEVAGRTWLMAGAGTALFFWSICEPLPPVNRSMAAIGGFAFGVVVGSAYDWFQFRKKERRK